jgi:hypothetical protein
MTLGTMGQRLVLQMESLDTVFLSSLGRYALQANVSYAQCSLSGLLPYRGIFLKPLPTFMGVAVMQEQPAQVQCGHWN